MVKISFTSPVLLDAGVIGMEEAQAKRRAPGVLEEIEAGIYEIKKSISLKAGETVRLRADAVPKAFYHLLSEKNLKKVRSAIAKEKKAIDAEA